MIRAAPYSPETLALIRSMSRTHSPAQIAERLAWDCDRLKRIARQHGIEIAPLRAESLPDAVEAPANKSTVLEKLKKIGEILKARPGEGWMTSAAIGQSLGIHPSSVSSYISRFRTEFANAGYPIESSYRWGYRIAKGGETIGGLPPRKRFELSADMNLEEIVHVMTPAAARVFRILMLGGVNAHPTRGNKIASNIGVSNAAIAVQVSLIRTKLRPTRWTIEGMKGEGGGYRIVDVGAS